MVGDKRSSIKRYWLILVASFCLSAGTTHAAPVQWFIYDLAFADGGTGSGSFFFDADLPTGSFGAYSNIDVTISGGSLFADTTYNSFHPSSLSTSDEFMWFVVDSSIFPGDLTFAATLVDQMTGAGGEIDFLTTGNPDFFSQSVCLSTTTSNCALGGALQNIITGGYVSTTAPIPLPAAIWLLGSALLGVVYSGRRNRRQ